MRFSNPHFTFNTADIGKHLKAACQHGKYWALCQGDLVKWNILESGVARLRKHPDQVLLLCPND